MNSISDVFNFQVVEVLKDAIEAAFGNTSLNFWVDVGGERIDEGSLEVLPIVAILVAAILTAAFHLSGVDLVVSVQADEVVDYLAHEVALDVGAGFEAVHDRHVDVKDDDRVVVRWFVPDCVVCLQAIVCAFNGEVGKEPSSMMFSSTKLSLTSNTVGLARCFSSLISWSIMIRASL